MKTMKKMLAVVTVLAMMFSMATMLSLSASASNWRRPTYDRKTGGWNVNDFRREGGQAPAFSNSIGIYPNGIEKGDLDNDNVLHLILPPDVAYNDIGGLRASFDFGNLDADGMAELPNMAVIAQHSLMSWDDVHYLHVDSDARLDCDFTDFCKNKCNYDKNNNATVLFRTPNSKSNGEVVENSYLRITLTCDWNDYTGSGTPGSARVQLINKRNRVIPLYIWCNTCQGSCQCPCPGCGQGGVGTCTCCDICDGDCECDCAICGKPQDECECGDDNNETENNNNQSATCPDCGELKADCVCEHDDESSEGDLRFEFKGKFEDLVSVYLNDGLMTTNVVNDEHWDLFLFRNTDYGLGDNFSFTKTAGKAYSGSVVVVLYADLIEKIPAGTHTLTVEYEDGTTESQNFVIESGDEVTTDETEETDGNMPTGIALAVIPVLLAAGAVVISRKRK